MRYAKLFSVVLALLLIINVGLCPVASASIHYDAANEGRSITLMVDGTFMLPEAGQEELIKKYKEMTGIDLIIIQPAHNEYYEKLNLLFATDELPDIVVLSADYSERFGKNGVLVDLQPYVEKSQVLQSVDYDTFIAPMLTDGQLFSFPTGPSDGCVTFVRQDWLDTLGLQVPTSYDEFLEMLRAFKTIDESIIPYTAPGIISEETPYTMYTAPLFQGANPDFVQVDGLWVDGMLQPNMREALTRWQAAFNEGLVDMEIITNKTSSCRDKLASGITGAFTYWGEWADALEDNLKATDPNASLAVLDAFDGMDYVSRVPTGLAITTAADADFVFENFIELIYDCGEGQMLFTNGVEDVHYTYANGDYELLPAPANSTQPAGQTLMMRANNINNWDDPYTEDPRIAAANSILFSNMEMIAASPYTEASDKYGADLLIKRKEILAEIVYGVTTVEEGLARYEAESAELTAPILAELNQ